MKSWKCGFGYQVLGFGDREILRQAQDDIIRQAQGDTLREPQCDMLREPQHDKNNFGDFSVVGIVDIDLPSFQYGVTGPYSFHYDVTSRLRVSCFENLSVT